MDNILRAIVLGEIVVTFLLTLVIFYHYGKRQHLEKQLKTNLTWHVVSMIVVFLAVCGYCFMDILLRFGTPLTWRSPVLIPTFTLSNVGLYFMLRFQINRRR